MRNLSSKTLPPRGNFQPTVKNMPPVQHLPERKKIIEKASNLFAESPFIPFNRLVGAKTSTQVPENVVFP